LKLQVLGENPPPAPKIDPLLHKRSTDGQWVRLYCAQCGHSNFSNTQGFLNHCRIKHNQVFKSHDQAAIACGVPVDKDEAGNPVSMAEQPSTTTPTPAAISFPTPTGAPGSVHPLIRSNPSEWAKDVHRDFNKSTSDESIPSPTAEKTEFVKAPSTPYLNSLLSAKGFEGNFKGLVETARTKVDLSSIESLEDDKTDSACQTPLSARPLESPVSLPSGQFAPPSSRPGTKGQSSPPARLPHIPSPVSVGQSADSPELSPHPAESNPGLVSDHDDDDDEDGYDARSQSDMAMDDAFVVEDADDVEGAQERAGCRKRLEGCFSEGSRKH
jgi:ADA HAT complex component 1